MQSNMAMNWVFLGVSMLDTNSHLDGELFNRIGKSHSESLLHVVKFLEIVVGLIVRSRLIDHLSIDVVLGLVDDFMMSKAFNRSLLHLEHGSVFDFL